MGKCEEEDADVRILNVARGKLSLLVGERTITLSGEMMPPENPVNFYADLASINRWDDGTPVSDGDKARIVEELPKVAAQQNWTITID
jgi:hypothetical protein